MKMEETPETQEPPVGMEDHQRLRFCAHATQSWKNHERQKQVWLL